MAAVVCMHNYTTTSYFVNMLIVSNCSTMNTQLRGFLNTMSGLSELLLIVLPLISLSCTTGKELGQPCHSNCHGLYK